MTILMRFQEFLRLNGGHPECENFAGFVEAESKTLTEKLAGDCDLMRLAGEAEAFQRYFWLHIATDAREQMYSQFCLDKWGENMPLLLTIQLPQEMSFNKRRNDQIQKLIQLAVNKNHGSTTYCCLPYVVQKHVMPPEMTVEQLDESCAKLKNMLETCAAYGGNTYIAVSTRNGENVYGFVVCAAGVFAYDSDRVRKEFFRNVGEVWENIAYKKCRV